MEKVKLGKTGLEISRLGFGAAPIGYLDTKQSQVARVVNELLDEGVNFIDTAACYPGSETLIGQSVSHRRADYHIASKCGHRVEGIDADPWSSELIEQSIELTLKRLETDYIDIMMLHSCSLQVLEQGEAIAALVRAREAGKIGFIGYSGDNEAARFAAAHAEIAVVEMSINITDQNNIDTVLPTCRAHEVGVVAKRPLANAAWRALSEQPGMYSQYAEVYMQRLKAMNITPFNLGFTGLADVEWPEIALRFVLSIADVHSAIVGTTSTVNARANLAAAQKGVLPDDVFTSLRDAFKSAQAQAGQTWTGQT